MKGIIISICLVSLIKTAAADKAQDPACFELQELPEIQVVEKKLKELNVENKKLMVEYTQMCEENKHLIDLKTEESKKLLEKVSVDWEPNRKRLKEIRTDLLVYQRFQKAIDSVKNEITKEENYARRNIIKEMKKELPYDLYKEVPLYKKLIEEAGFRLMDLPFRPEDSLRKAVSNYEKKMNECKKNAFAYLWGKPSSLRALENKKRKEGFKGEKRVKVLSETVPQIKACNAKYNELQKKIKDKNYTDKELAEYSLDELKKKYTAESMEQLRQRDSLAWEMDEEYRKIQKAWQDIAKEQKKLLYEKWFTEKRESFDEYCKWLTLKARTKAQLGLVELKKRHSIRNVSSAKSFKKEVEAHHNCKGCSHH